MTICGKIVRTRPAAVLGRCRIGRTVPQRAHGNRMNRLCIVAPVPRVAEESRQVLFLHPPLVERRRRQLQPEESTEKQRSRTTGQQSPMLATAVPLVLLPFVPASLLPGSLSDASFRWVFEEFIGTGSVTMGIAGLVSLGIFINPMLEAMPRIRKNGCVGKFPLLPYSAMAAQGMVWTTYGLIVGNPAIWTPNFIAMLLGLRYWKEFRTFCPPNADWLPLTEKHHRLVFFGTAALCGIAASAMETSAALTCLGLTGNVMTLKMFGGPLAAMRTVIREKSTKAMALGFTLIVNLNCNLWFFYAYFMLNDPYIYVQDGIGLLLTTVQLALFARYGIHR